MPSALIKILLRWAIEVVDEASHHGVVGPGRRLMQVDVEVWWKKANRASMECPQVIDDQAFIAT